MKKRPVLHQFKEKSKVVENRVARYNNLSEITVFSQALLTKAMNSGESEVVISVSFTTTPAPFESALSMRTGLLPRQQEF